MSTTEPTQHQTPAAADLRAALADLTDAFLSRHGCFPLDQTNDDQRHWYRAMSRAYELVGQPNTSARSELLAASTPQAGTLGLDREAVALLAQNIMAHCLAVDGDRDIVGTGRAAYAIADAILAATAVSQPPTSRQGAGEVEALQAALEETQSLLAMLQHIGPDADSWKTEDAQDQICDQLASNRLLLTTPAQPGPAPVGDGGATEAQILETARAAVAQVLEAEGLNQAAREVRDGRCDHEPRVRYSVLAIQLDRAALDSIPAVGGAIETAPKNDCILLFGRLDRSLSPVSWHIGKWFEHHAGGFWMSSSVEVLATAWAPLPAAPTQTARDGGE